jgi:hypothetical protein
VRVYFGSEQNKKITMETLKETLQAQQAEAINKFRELDGKAEEAKNYYVIAKLDRDEQKLIVDQNARALKAFEPRKPRAKKTPKQ